MSNKKTLLIIDPLAESIGHLLDDDLFWATHLVDKFSAVCIASSKASIDRIKARVPKVETRPFKAWYDLLGYFPKFSHLKYIMRMFTGTRGFDIVLMQSYHELSALLFTYFHPRTAIYLIVTNNLTGEGALTARKKVLQKLLFSRVKAVFLHSRYEQQLIEQNYSEKVLGKVVIKPFHKIAQNRRIIPLNKRRQQISYFGFARKERGLDNYLRWAVNDKSSKYTYGIYGKFDLSAVNAALLQKISAPVEIIQEYIPDDEYFKLISESLFVALPFNRIFEGRLSGVLCDAIACGTPLIAAKIEPHMEFFEKYGDLGYLIDINDLAAWRAFLMTDTSKRWDVFQESLQNARKANAADQVIAVVMNVLDGEL